MRRFLVLGLPIVLFSGSAVAYPGPDSVAVLVSQDSAESVALADAYAKFRAVPAKQVCKIPGIPQTDDVSLADYQTKILAPFEQCLTTNGVHDRIEAVLVTRGVPMRVVVPISSGSTNISLAAALAVWESTMQGGDAGGAPLLGQDPGAIVNCGSPCYGAGWPNPMLNLATPYKAGYTATKNGVVWKPLLVTMLHGRSQADAQMLIDSATSAEKNGGAKGTFMFMDSADGPSGPRGVLDSEFPNVINQLKALGFTDAQEVPWNADLTGQTLASFFVGTSSIGTTIEGNTYQPGSLVDNLTSFGAVPQNFATSGESQVSISRWVEKGVGGVQGTVDEPLNNVFPNRNLIVDYVKGATLAEAYFRWFPFVYWKNLVLGDPMLAPYAKRPVVTITGLTDGATQTDATMVTATATDGGTGVGVASVTLYVDGVMAATAQGDTVTTCVKVPAASSVQILAVAQTNAGTGGLVKFQPKGWSEIHVTGQSGGNAQCPAQNDGGDVADAGTDGGEGSETSGGCSCNESPASSSGFAAIFVALGVFFSRRSSRASSSRRR
jgi:uncharacterized protein (TIGR03790 family)